MVFFVSKLISKLSYVSDEVEIFIWPLKSLFSSYTRLMRFQSDQSDEMTETFKYMATKERVQFIHTVASKWQFLLCRLGQFLKQVRGELYSTRVPQSCRPHRKRLWDLRVCYNQSRPPLLTLCHLTAVTKGCSSEVFVGNPTVVGCATYTDLPDNSLLLI